MSCRSCGSSKQVELTAEILIHFPLLRNLNKPGVLLFPMLWVCLDCGFSGFTVPDTELASVAEDTLADKSATLEGAPGDVHLSREDRVQGEEIETIDCLSSFNEMVN